MRIVHVVGVRPNFIKIAPVMDALERHGNVEQHLVHTGQHFDDAMSRVFFEDLEIPKPLVNLDVGRRGTHSHVRPVMVELEPVLRDLAPDLVVVVGDVDSTLAAALVAARARIPCAHIEAGLRSFDPSVREEVNRVVTDRVADLLLTPSEDADHNLIAEGLRADRIRRVGNVMADTLLAHIDAAKVRPVLANMGLVAHEYAVATLHRPSNVDQAETLAPLCEVLEWAASRLPVVWPLHPRTRANLVRFGLLDRLRRHRNLHVAEPMGYLDFIALTAGAKVVLTDSGGLQEETTVLGVPCLTLRDRTERPVTVTVGTNTVVGVRPDDVRRAVAEVLAGRAKLGSRPPLWDGKASERVAQALVELDSRLSDGRD